MDYSEILIYIIVISVVFISTIAKKRVINNNSTQTHTKPQETKRSTNKIPKIPRTEKYNWRDNIGKTETPTPKAEDSPAPVSTPAPAKSPLPLNSADELRQAVILSEILKRKF